MPIQPAQHYRRPFAPPPTRAPLAPYPTAANRPPPSPVKDGMLALLPAVDKWFALPEPTGPPTGAHPVVGAIQNLSADAVAALDDLIPWEHELVGIGDVFETIDPASQKELRDAAHHLL